MADKRGHNSDAEVRPGRPNGTDSGGGVTLPFEDNGPTAEVQSILEEIERLGGLGYFEQDHRNKSIHWSDGLYRLLGRSHSDGPLLLDQIFEQVIPEDRRAASELLDALRFRPTAIASLRVRRFDTREHRMFQIKATSEIGSDGQVNRVSGLFVDTTESEPHRAPDSPDDDSTLTASTSAGSDGNNGGARISSSDITQDLAAAERFRRSERKYQQLFQGMVDACALLEVVFDDDGRPVDLIIREVNDAYETTTGKTREEVLNTRIGDWHPQTAVEAQVWLDKYEHVGQSESPIRFEQRSDSLDKWFSVALSSPAEGQLALMFTDISDRRAAEQKTDQYRQLLDKAEQLSMQGAWEWDIPTDTWTFSENWYRILGVDASLMTTPELNKLAHPDDLERVNEAMRACVEHGSKYEIEHRVIRQSDQSVRFVKASGEVLCDDNGRPLKMWGAGQDITDQKEALVRLQSSEAKLLRAQEIARLGFWEWNPSTRKTVWSDKMYDIFGLERSNELSYENLIRLIHPDDLAHLKDVVESAIESKDQFTLETRVIKPDGQTIWVLTEARIERDTRRQIVKVNGTSQDVTLRKRRDEQMRESAARLQLAVSSAHIGPWDWDLTTNALYLSPEWKRQLGFNDDELENTFFTWASRLHPDDKDRVQKTVDDWLGGKLDKYQTEFRLRHRSGEYRWMEARAEKIVDEHGKPVRVLGCHLDITDRKTQEERLRESEERFRKSFEASAVGMATVAADGTFLSVNPAVCKILKYAEDDLLAMNFVDITHPDDRERSRERLEQCLYGDKKHYTIEKTYLTSDGDIIHGLTTVSPIYSADGELLYLVAQLQDVTESRTAVDELRASEESLRAIFDHNGNGIAIADSETHRLLRVNRTMCEMLGYSEEELTGKAVEDLHPKEALEEALTAFRELSSGDREQYSEAPMKRRDGSVFHADIRAGRIEYDGRSCLIGVFHDVTQRKEAADTVKRSEARLQTLINTVPDLIWLKDPDGVYLACNPRFEQFFGAQEAEIIGKTDYDFVDKELADFFRERDRLAIEFGRPSVNEETVQFASDGHRELLETIKTPMFTDDGELIGVLGIGHDITARKNASSALAESERKFRSLVSNIAGAVYRCEPQSPWRLTYCSNGVLELTGYPASDFVSGKITWADILNPQDHETVEAVIAEAVSKKEAFTVEYRLVKRDGSIIWVLERGRVEYDDSGDAVSLDGIVHDITARKQTELALQESEQRFNYAVEASRDGLWDWNVVTGEMYFSPRWLEIVGEDQMESSYHGWVDRIHPDDKEGVLQALEDHLQGRTSQLSGEYRLKTADGFWKWVLGRGMIVERDTNGTPVRMVGTLTDISDRKAMEIELRRERDRADRYLNAAEVILMALDLAGNITLINRKGCELLGASRSEILGRNWFDSFLRDQDREAIHQVFEEIIAGNVAVLENQEGTILRPDGGERVISWSNSFVHDDDGNLVGVFCSGKDVTEKRRIEEAAKESEERFREIFDESPLSILLVDIESGDIVEFNRRTASLLGYTMEEFRSLRLSDVDAYEDEEQVARHVQEIAEAGHGSFETKHVTKDGRLLDVVVSLRLITWKGKPHIINIWTDVTAERQVERALVTSEEKYRSLVESADIGIALIDRDMRLLSVNRRMREWFPDVGTDICSPCYSALRNPPRTEPCPDCPVVKSMADGQVHETVTDTPTPDGTRNFRLISSPIFGADGEIASVIETIEDVTEKMRMDKELQKQAKLESLGVLAGGIAHDFNNILTAITGNLSMARMEVQDDGPLSEALDQAATAAERATGLTRQLLTFAKGGAPIMRASSIGSVLYEAAGFALHGSRAECRYRIPDDLPPVEIDAGQIQQVVQNVIINAVQAMPEGGTIEIEAREMKIDKRSALPLEPGSYVIVSVSDSGCGISESHLRRIFDPFFTTKERGSGLGLASCFSILRAHKGLITADSTVGEGSVFTFYLPVSGATVMEAEQPESAPAKGGGRVLAVDDETVLRNLFKRGLETFGYEVAVSPDGHDAIKRYREAMDSGSPFDVVILDLTIPGGLGGKEILQRLRDLDSSVTAIVSSGYSNDPIMANYEDYGFQGRLLKPFRTEDLAKAVGQALKVSN